MYILNLVRTARFRYTQGQKIGKPKNLKICRSNKTQRPKQNSQNRCRSPMSEKNNLKTKINR